MRDRSDRTSRSFLSPTAMDQRLVAADRQWAASVVMMSNVLAAHRAASSLVDLRLQGPLLGGGEEVQRRPGRRAPDPDRRPSPRRHRSKRGRRTGRTGNEPSTTGSHSPRVGSVLRGSVASTTRTQGRQTVRSIPRSTCGSEPSVSTDIDRMSFPDQPTSVNIVLSVPECHG